MVMGGDSCSKDRGFESRCRILDGHDIFHIDLLYCLLEKTEINKKRPGLYHFFKKSRKLYK